MRKIIFLMSFLVINVIYSQEYTKMELSLMKKGFIPVISEIKSVQIDLKYATSDNFVGKRMYHNLNNVFLNRKALDKLKKANKILKEYDCGMNFVIYDALRPRKVQFQMWEVVKNTPQKNYVANPYRGSIHNYGCSLDISIEKNGIPLDMGTPYDFLEKKSQPRYNELFFKKGLLTREQIDNRKLLRKVMTKAGFYPINTEWWHFNAFPAKFVRKNFKIVE